MKIDPMKRVLVLVFLLLFVLICCHKEEEKYAQTLLRTLDSGKVLSTKNAMDRIAYSLNRYMMDNGKFPEGEDIGSITSALCPAYTAELSSRDAWGNELHYDSGGGHFSLIASGEDGTFDNEDDVVMIDGTYR